MSEKTPKKIQMKKQVKIPTKKTLNLLIKEKTLASPSRLIPILVIIVLGAYLFSKYADAGRLEKVNREEAELAEKLERLTELNALLNMDEKGGDGIDMDDESENDGEQEEMDTEEMGNDAEAVADAPFKPQINRAVSEKVAEHGKEQMLSDSPRGRISVKEKLAEMRQKAYGQKMPEKPEISKGKGKEESL